MEATMPTHVSKRVPKNALMFEGGSEFTLSDKGDGSSKRTMQMLAYSGGVIKDHWYWGDLAIDVTGLKFPKTVIPVLESHFTDRKVGITKKPSVENNQVFFEKIEFLDTPYADEFIRLSDQGFPYQASIAARPLKIEYLQDGASAEVNGYTLKGPATIWREANFRETSICVFGYDSQTSSKAMSKDDEFEDLEFESVNAFNQNPEDQEEPMPFDFKKAKAENPEAFAEYEREIRTAAETSAKESFEKTVSEKDKEIETLKSQASEMAKDNQNLGVRLAQLEKKDALRDEAEKARIAHDHFKAQLSESSIPVHLHEKVMRQISHTDFCDEKTGSLDMEKFSAAVKAEISSWGDFKSPKIAGMGATGRTVADEEGTNDKLSEDEDAAVKRMAAVTNHDETEK
jgi:regulator of replication initiation timing